MVVTGVQPGDEVLWLGEQRCNPGVCVLLGELKNETLGPGTISLRRYIHVDGLSDLVDRSVDLGPAIKDFEVSSTHQLWR
jgi:hypothetical protein